MTEAFISLKTAAIEKKSHSGHFKIGVSVDCVIFGYEDKELKVLTIQSDLKEFLHLNSLLGDFVNPGEDIDAAPYRILKERTGLDDVYMEQVQAFGNPARHPSGRVITIAYYSLIDIKHHKLQLGDHDLHWHTVKKLKKMAFDHKLILDTCLRRLREQVIEHPVVFNLLPKKFSLRQLQELYEAILDETLDRRNFRKKIAAKDWLNDINEMEKDIPHRPGKLYTLKKQFKKKNGNGVSF
jgi:8-oxo-dGTP diphosphatase